MRTRRREVLLWAIILAVPVVGLVACVEAYYAYHKLSYADIFCGSFARVDDELGWTLAPNAESCYRMPDPGGADGYAFDSKIVTDANGFRAARRGDDTPTGGIMAVGDSWTFGYGVDYEASFPALLSRTRGQPVVTVASPAYGAAQALALAERWMDDLEPVAIVYLDIGQWERSTCRGQSRPFFILKPCYWVDPANGDTALVLPPPSLVTRAARLGIKPGGMLGAGEDGWDYFLVSRPIAKMTGLLARLGVLSGMAHDFRPVGVDPMAIRRGVADHLLRVATESGVPVLVLDPTDAYAHFEDRWREQADAPILRVGRFDWHDHVVKPSFELPPDERSVPHDGHYGPGTNKLIAGYIAGLLETLEGRDAAGGAGPGSNALADAVLSVSGPAELDAVSRAAAR